MKCPVPKCHAGMLSDPHGYAVSCPVCDGTITAAQFEESSPPGGVTPAQAWATCDGDCVPACIYREKCPGGAAPETGDDR